MSFGHGKSWENMADKETDILSSQKKQPSEVQTVLNGCLDKRQTGLSRSSRHEKWLGTRTRLVRRAQERAVALRSCDFRYFTVSLWGQVLPYRPSCP